jgi:putative tricarboxylic transport membrane protein
MGECSVACWAFIIFRVKVASHLENLAHLLMGFQLALTAANLLAGLLGVTVGVLIGALPGFGPSAGVAILLPMVFGMQPSTAMIILCGIYYGAMFGGAITAILINTPGDSAAVMTSIDGYSLTQQGRAGPALGMSTMASFIGGTVGVLALTFIAPVIARFALSFGPSEYFALMVLGMTTLVGMIGGDPTKGILMGLTGLFLSVVGADIMTGQQRFVFGMSSLWQGIDFIPVVMGLFGFSEVLKNSEEELKIVINQAKLSLRDVFPTKQDFKESAGALGRGSLIGFLIGVLPGAGATIASFISYGIAKKLSKHPEKFGKGAIEGVAAPESANNAAAAGAMVPLLTLGLPGSGTTAVMLGALIMLGLRPGPMLFRDDPAFVYTVIASMYIGNLLLVVLNLVGIPVFISILKIPYSILMPSVMVFLILGVYSLELVMVNVWIMIFFGILGYFLKKLDYPGAPLVLSLVLGPILEQNLRRALTISHGNISILFNSPTSCFLLVISVFVLVWPLIKGMMQKKKHEEALP